MKKTLISLTGFLLLFSLTACNMDDNQPKSGGQNDDKAADAAEIDPLYLDQGYIDPDTGEFVPARMEESEEARKKRLAEEKHLSSEANGDNEGGAEGNNE